MKKHNKLFALAVMSGFLCHQAAQAAVKLAVIEGQLTVQKSIKNTYANGIASLKTLKAATTIREIKTLIDREVGVLQGELDTVNTGIKGLENIRTLDVKAIRQQLLGQKNQLSGEKTQVQNTMKATGNKKLQKIIDRLSAKINVINAQLKQLPK